MSLTCPTKSCAFSIQDQIKKEIRYTFHSIPWMGLLTSVVFVLEVNGYSKLYDSLDDSQYGR